MITIGSFLLFMPCIVLVNNFNSASISQGSMFNEYLRQPQYWLSILLCSAIVSLPYYAFRNTWRQIISPKFDL